MTTVTTENAEDIYLDHIDMPYGKDFAAAVGRVSGRISCRSRDRRS